MSAIAGVFVLFACSSTTKVASSNDGGAAAGGVGGNGGSGTGGGAGASGGSGGGTGGSAGASGSSSGGTGGTGGTSDAGKGGAAGSDAGVDASAMKRVFVTSARYSGDLKTEGNATSGVLGADAICNKHGAALGGTWKAWISAGQSAYDRIQSNGPWYRVDGTLVFPDRASLKGLPKVPIAKDEKGFTYTSNLHVWTGTDVGGTPATNGQRCSGWTGGVGTFGQYGNMNAAGTAWTNAGVELCGPSRNRLICFEQ